MPERLRVGYLNDREDVVKFRLIFKGSTLEWVKFFYPSEEEHIVYLRKHGVDTSERLILARRSLMRLGLSASAAILFVPFGITARSQGSTLVRATVRSVKAQQKRVQVSALQNAISHLVSASQTTEDGLHTHEYVTNEIRTDEGVVRVRLGQGEAESYETTGSPGQIPGPGRVTGRTALNNVTDTYQVVLR